MKNLYNKLILLLALAVFSVPSYSTTYTIEVEDNEFDPAVLNVNVGDTLVFLWDEGVHTTTSVNIPPGAQWWDAGMDQSHPVFIYIPNLPGSYDYQCTFHSSMGMIGHFTVYPATFINEEQSSMYTINGSVINEKLNITFKRSQINRLEIMSLTGITVKKFFSASGSLPYTEQFNTSDLAPGIYILHILNNDKVFSSRIIKE